MSIHHEVTVHCDLCGQWQAGNVCTTRQRRKDGWRIWREWGDAGPWRHVCPACATKGAEQVAAELADKGIDADHYPTEGT